jgi:outer membrane protein, heavy metal efflux system
MRTSIGLALGLCCAAVQSGCVTSSSQSDRAAVSDIVRERTRSDFSDPRSLSNEAIERDVSGLLQKELTLDNAMRIALINNPQLRAELAGLGIARGQLVQANMIPTVDFELAVLFPQGQEHPNKWEVGATVDLTQLILRGPRTDSAQAELDAARIRAAAAALDLGYRVRLAYYDVQAAEQQLELYRTAMQAFGASYDAARELRRAGNAIELDVATEQTAYEGARVAVAEAEADLIDARERLNIQLGLFGRSIAWQVTQRLPDPASTLGDLNKLETRAIEASLELAETRAQLLALARQVGVSAGVAAAKHDGIWFVGPSVHGTVPMFDRLQGSRLAQEAELEGMRERYQANAIEIRATLRAARDRALSAQARVEQYRDTVLPLRERVVQQTLLQYNAMQIGVFQLLQARRDQLEAARNYVVTLHEYWRSRAALEQILAGRLVASLGVMSRAQRSGSAISSGGGSVDSH